jgi:adenine specific DNA methylase Mod
MPRKHNTIYWYGFNNIYNTVYIPYSQNSVVTLGDPERGKILEDHWTDINNNQSKGGDAVFFPTQKPYKLLKRVICLSTV